MKKQFLFIILVSTSILLYAQNKSEIIKTRPLNNISINFLGDASILSLNYEKLFLVSSTFILSCKLGLGFNEEFRISFSGLNSSPPKRYLTIPHHVTGNIGKGRHFLEFGFGGTIISSNATPHYWFYPIVGYRYLPLKSGKINVRVFGQIPFSELYGENIFFMPFGLSLGISF